MKRPRLRAYLGLGLLVCGLGGLALSTDLIVHIERFVAFYGPSPAGSARQSRFGAMAHTEHTMERRPRR
jgi:hypothetical protein